MPSLLHVRAEGGAWERWGWALTHALKNCARNRAEKVALSLERHRQIFEFEKE